MNDMNKVLIFVLLAILIYAVYKYQDQIMALTKMLPAKIEQKKVEESPQKQKQKKEQKRKETPIKKDKKAKKVSLDNISQISISTAGDDIEEGQESLNLSFLQDDNSRGSKESFFFNSE